MAATLTRRDHCEVPGKRLQRGLLRDKRCEALDKSAIAELSAGLIDRMTCDELVRIIRAAEVPVLGRPDLYGRLPFYDRETLQRLAHVARRCCQMRNCEPSRDGSRSEWS